MTQPIIFTGSSIIALWESLPPSLAGLPTLNTAVSGAQTADLMVRLDELVIRHNPCAVCYYCGSNDLNAAVPPAQICANVLDSFAAIRRHRPGARLMYLSVIKAPQKRDRWAQVDEVNRSLQSAAQAMGSFDFIDINPVFFAADGQPRLDFYVEDFLHLTRAAYAGLGAYLAPRLEALLVG